MFLAHFLRREIDSNDRMFKLKLDHFTGDIRMGLFSLLRRKWGKADQSWRSDSRWLNVRAQVVARDKGKCQICFSSRKLEVHHLDGAAWFPKKRWEKSNLITLCRRHHHSYHRWNGGFRRKSTAESFKVFVRVLPSDFGARLRWLALNRKTAMLLLLSSIFTGVFLGVSVLT